MTLAVIGGSGLVRFFDGLPVEVADTSYGEPSAAVSRCNLDGHSVLFLPRHGVPHSIAPHRINYRANLWALRQAGATAIVALNTVGAIRSEWRPGSFVVPHQLIDYTHGRDSSFFEGLLQPLQHIDFTEPMSPLLRERLVEVCQFSGAEVQRSAVYAVTQGPRLESAAEINRLERDGCDIVGMTLMPEAALARELGMDYASLCLVVNPAAGRGAPVIDMAQVEQVMQKGAEGMMTMMHRLVTHYPW